VRGYVGYPLSNRLHELIPRVDITDVLYRCCREIDRRDFDLVRSWHHPDAAEEHGDYVGDVDGFLARAASNVAPCERTMHFLGNILVEVDGAVARSESYVLALHRLPAAGVGRGARDRTVVLRYLDLFTLRDGNWRISERRCVCDWTRTDPVPEDPSSHPTGCGGRRVTTTRVCGDAWREPRRRHEPGMAGRRLSSDHERVAIPVAADRRGEVAVDVCSAPGDRFVGLRNRADQERAGLELICDVLGEVVRHDDRQRGSAHRRWGGP
jgi:hypothetical protein